MKPFGRRLLEKPLARAAMMFMPILATLSMSMYGDAREWVNVVCLVSIGFGFVEHAFRLAMVKYRIYKRSRATVRLLA